MTLAGRLATLASKGQLSTSQGARRNIRALLFRYRSRRKARAPIDISVDALPSKGPIQHTWAAALIPSQHLSHGRRGSMPRPFWITVGCCGYDSGMPEPTCQTELIFPTAWLTQVGGGIAIVTDSKSFGPAGAQSAGNSIGSFELLLKAAVTKATQLEKQLPGLLKARDAAYRIMTRASRFPLNVLFAWFKGALKRNFDNAEKRLQELAGERNNCMVRLQICLTSEAIAGYGKMGAAFSDLQQSRQIWQVLSGFENPKNPKLVTVHSPSISRDPTSVAYVEVEELGPDWLGLSFQLLGAGSVDLLPGFVAVRGSGARDQFSLVDILGLKVEARTVLVAERDPIPSDTREVNHTWERINKDGTPDKRISNNPRIPIVHYGLLHLDVPGHARYGFLVSNAESGKRFAAAFLEYQNVLRGGTGSSGSTSLSQPAAASLSPTADTPSRRNPVVTVPPPPHVSAPHEYTAAIVVAMALAIWLPKGSTVGFTASAPLTQQVMKQEPSASVIHAPMITPPMPVLPTQLVTVGPPQQPAAPAAALSDTTAMRQKVVTRSAANVRAGPDSGAAVVRTAAAGLRLNVFGRANGWVAVGDTDRWGWIYSTLLDAAE
jgi:hypothetical protein